MQKILLINLCIFSLFIYGCGGEIGETDQDLDASEFEQMLTGENDLDSEIEIGTGNNESTQSDQDEDDEDNTENDNNGDNNNDEDTSDDNEEENDDYLDGDPFNAETNTGEQDQQDNEQENSRFGDRTEIQTENNNESEDNEKQNTEQTENQTDGNDESENENEGDDEENTYTIEQFGNWTALYNTYIQNEIDTIIDNGGDYDVENIVWIRGNTAQFNYTDGENTYRGQLEFSYDDAVYVDNLMNITNQVDEIGQRYVESSDNTNSTEDSVNNNEDFLYIIEDINLSEYIENGSVNYALMYGTNIEENINNIINDSEDYEVVSISWIEGNTARITYSDGDDEYLGDVEVSYRNGNIRIHSFDKVVLEDTDTTNEDDLQETNGDETSNSNEAENESSESNQSNENDSDEDISYQQVDLDDHSMEDGSVNFSSLYAEFIETNLDSIVGNGKDYQLDDIYWTQGTVAEIAYSDGENNYLAEIEVSFNYADGVSIESFQRIENSENVLENEDVVESSSSEENTNIVYQNSIDNIDNHLDEDDNINYSSLYGTFLMSNIDDIVGDGGEYDVVNLYWLDGNIVQIEYTDGQENDFMEVEVSYRDGNVRLHSINDLGEDQVGTGDPMGQNLQDSDNLEDYIDIEW